MNTITQYPQGKLTVLVALSAALLAGKAGAHYQAVVLPFPGPADVEALDVSHNGCIVGMIEPKGGEPPPNPILWFPNLNDTNLITWTWKTYRMTSPSGGAPLGNGRAYGIDRILDFVIGSLWISPRTEHAFYEKTTVVHNGVEAIVWEDLAPPRVSGSVALAAHAGIVVGAVRGSNSGHIEAGLWNGDRSGVTAAHFVSLHPASFHHSLAEDTNSFIHVGWGGATAQDDHALAWWGTANVPILLHPNGYVASKALAIDSIRNQIAGYADEPAGVGAFRRHAMVWNTNNTGYAPLDIHPRDLDESEARAAGAGVIAGWGCGKRTAGFDRALIWTAGGSGGDFDLHQFLPPGFVGSECAAIHPVGLIVGTATTSRGERRAIAWVPVTDFSIVHDAPVLYVPGTGVATATGRVVFETPVSQDTAVDVRAGVSSQKVTVPAGASEGKFSLPVFVSGMTSTFQVGFSARSGGVTRQATLMVILRPVSVVPLPPGP